MPAEQRAAKELAMPACKSCGAALQHTFVDLGTCPLANSYLTAEQLTQREPAYPLHARVCERCFLVQVEEFEQPENIFGDYAYFSSYSDTWLEHARRYVEQMIARLGLDARSQVVEIASNDGYLLQYFVARGIPVLGIEPAANVAAAAMEKGIPTRTVFFNPDTARQLVGEGKQADLLLGNNVLAHVPDLNGFVSALAIALKPGGTITMEFPHVMRLIEGNQFDTIYHEHFFYFTLHTVENIFAKHGLTLFDVEELSTHGGSLRIFAAHAAAERPRTPAIADVKQKELQAGLLEMRTYTDFGRKVQETRRALVEFLQEARKKGKTVAAYGAPAKGNTLLNYCGIGSDQIAFTVDRNPHKQGRFLPGSHIPIYAPEKLREYRPDYVLILPWNLRDEIVSQMAEVRQWGGRFVVPVPRAEVLA